MVGLNVKVKFTKQLKLSTPNRLAAAQVGAIAFKMIRDRILKTGKLGDGTPIPKIVEGSWFTPLDDPRFKDGGETITTKVDGKATPVRLFEGGYADAKRSKGAEGKADGQLTGSMWKSANIVVTTRGQKDLIIVGFGGSSPGTGTKTTKSGKNKPVMVPNRDKAAAFQRRNPDGTRATSAKFALMGLTSAEMGILVRELMRYIRLFA